ncbi:DNA repair and recombination protein rad22 [Cavenderia fasciculata]|uniref:DNA repair and recombination protein rad22 n=1 Tax=Cavenderia fasciculata TaxID=261658 RepID=F4PZE8_CACFS|nr:DNA repair and recombination protein rad22 [Cavenderia fasciculata]EGG19177.1 DNA repair and recombination protein rad22 [Cavenderia fasciculata]|eukprot:XP_004366810.1 DNA repair and recombination protein rad22 [Cavenderia fasciculata]
MDNNELSSTAQPNYHLFGKVEFNDEEKQRITRELDTAPSQQDLQTRVAFGKSKVAYMEAWKVIEIANKIFGFNGWSSQLTNMKTDFTDVIGGNYKVGATAILRVTLKDGTFHEDFGFGIAINGCKGLAIENARKGAVSDARKRVLRIFGRALGNQLYQQSYNQQIVANKANPQLPPTLGSNNNQPPVNNNQQPQQQQQQQQQQPQQYEDDFDF